MPTVEKAKEVENEKAREVESEKAGGREKERSRNLGLEAGLYKKQIEIDGSFGSLVLLASDKGMRALAFPSDRYEKAEDGDGHPIIEQCARELREYFAGERREFTVPLDIQDGTDFQKRVWKSLLEIPYGSVISYSEQARRLGIPKAFRAVGAANGQNRLSILIPCHRVVNSQGALHGYAGGLAMKRWLLEREGLICEGNRIRV